MRHILSLWVENRAGVLARIAGLFAARNFNIDSLCVAETDDPTVSRMTIVTHGDDRIIEQVIKQLNKLIDVIKVVDLVEHDHVERELLLIKVDATNNKRQQIMEIVDIFRARIVDVGKATVTVELTGDEDKLSALIALMKPLGIKELMRTGKIAIMRAPK